MDIRLSPPCQPITEDRPPAVGFVGFSNGGKTTVLSAVISRLTAGGRRVGVVKHDVHGFSMDQPGKDTWRHKQAGAAATVISSPKGIGMVMDTAADTPLESLLALFSGMDIVLVEGYKRARIPKIEVYRPENGKPPACRGDACLIALVSDARLDWGVPRFGLADAVGIAAFITERFLTDSGLSQPGAGGDLERCRRGAMPVHSPISGIDPALPPLVALAISGFTSRDGSVNRQSGGG